MGDEKPDFTNVKTYPFAERENLVTVDMFGRVPDDPAALLPFYESLPDVLAARDLRKLAAAITSARDRSRGIILSPGGHVAKVGVTPYLGALLEKGFITHVACNGAFLIHDYELGRFGATSEDVAATLPDGRFGLCEETGAALNEFAVKAAADGVSVAQLAGEDIAANGTHPDASLLARAAAADVPVTVHVCLGADVIHQHPVCNGAAWGASTMADFRALCEAVKTLNDGGVFVNVGSAVVMPEVFVKALNLVRNVAPPVDGFTTANLDFIQHYRPRQNVLSRPVSGGDGIAVTGHHEIMIPLLACLVLAGAG
ncbi:MAG: hypothetical protein JSW52_08235 [Candidatus Coatesbacteria bacterium]|nr:MAG: hypothetical protein JSW52_08235 [Candidatus Coatesbacteria bacterium]